ncbi:hypothetical protein GCM10009665_04180 [Kitasatospora nipponensis]|uniref:DUF3592 domain-containing protein n=1 Tax=Kitasatospora nipponensis TaxID=258049 RepID=A0ABP4GBD7_9ACTN
MFGIGLLLCVLLGVEIGGVVAGIPGLGSGDVALFVIGVNLVPWTAIAGLGLLYGGLRRRRGLDRPGPTRAAPAKVESSRAVSEGPDPRLLLDLTVAPADRPAYRVEVRVTVNIMDLDDFRAGRIVLVDYEPDRPWRVTARPRRDSEWTDRVLLAKIDSAPPETRLREPVRVGGSATRFAVPAVAAGILLSLGPLWSSWSHWSTWGP